VWEKAVHAGLLHGWIKNKLGLAIFVRDRVVVLHGYAAKGLAVRCQTISKYSIVRGVRDSQQNRSRQERSYCVRSGSDSPERGAGSGAGFVFSDRGHGLNYTRLRIGSGCGVLTILHKKLDPKCLPARQNDSGDRW